MTPFPEELVSATKESFPLRGGSFSLEFHESAGFSVRHRYFYFTLRGVLWADDFSAILDVREQEVCLLAVSALPCRPERLAAYFRAVESVLEGASAARLKTETPASWFDASLLEDPALTSTDQFLEALAPELMAKREMVRWLAHPMEFGKPPTSIALWERRVMHWPPTNDERELFVFRYEYPSDEEGERMPRRGVGVVGGLTTFSLFGDTAPSPDGSVDEALAAHCAFELRRSADAR